MHRTDLSEIIFLLPPANHWRTLLYNTTGIDNSGQHREFSKLSVTLQMF